MALQMPFSVALILITISVATDINPLLANSLTRSIWDRTEFILNMYLRLHA